MKIRRVQLEHARKALRERARAFAERLAPVYMAERREWEDERGRYVSGVDQIQGRLNKLIDSLGSLPWDVGMEVMSRELKVAVYREGRSTRAWMSYLGRIVERCR